MNECTGNRATCSHPDPPYGGKRVDLLVADDERESLKAYAGRLPSVQISERAACDLELLATGGFYLAQRGFLR